MGKMREKDFDMTVEGVNKVLAFYEKTLIETVNRLTDSDEMLEKFINNFACNTCINILHTVVKVEINQDEAIESFLKIIRNVLTLMKDKE